MPWVPDTAEPMPRAPEGVTPPVLAPPVPSAIGPAFRQDNTVYNLYQSLTRETFPPDPDHKPLDLIRDTPYEQRHLDKFVTSSSAAETRDIMRRIDDEEGNDKVLDASGFAGFVARGAASLFSPEILLPAGTIYRSAKGGYSLVRSAGSAAAAGALATGVSETVLQTAQETRTMGESTAAIASSAILSGLIGTGAAAALSRVERVALETAIDTERAAIAAHANGLPAPAGAAAADERQLELPVTGLGSTARLSPTRRTLSAVEPEARRIVADTFETPYRYEGMEGPRGPTVERLIRQQVEGTRVASGDELKRAFSEYRFGDPQQSVPIMRSRFEDWTGRNAELMDYTAFKKEVSNAIMDGGEHSIPQVAQAAKFIRERVFEPWAKRAEETIPGFKRAEAEAYFPHVWNKERIRGERPEFVNKLTELYSADQDTKRAIQGSLARLNDELAFNQGEIRKLEAKIAALSEDAEVVQARAEEATRVNKFAFERSTALREGEFQNVGGIREAEPGKNIEKARGGAVFETKVRDRGNVLSDQLSAKLHQIDTLEQQLAKRTGDHDTVRARIEKEIGAWDGKTVGEAKSAMKAREKARQEREARAAEKGEAPPTSRLAAADAAIDSAVAAILKSDRNRPIPELRDRAHQTTDRIIGTPDGRLPYDEHLGGPQVGWKPGDPDVRGALQARQLNVSNAWARGWVEDDVERVVGNYLRTVVPDVLITERHGDVRMTEPLRRIEEGYARRIDRLGPNSKESKKLSDEKDRVIGDIAAMRDRIRGVFGWSADQGTQHMARVANSLKNVNNITSMGVAAVSSLPDLAGAVFRYGFATTFRDGWVPYFGNLVRPAEEWTKFKSQMRAINIGAETVLNARAHSLADITETFAPHSPVERTLQAVSDKFFIANLLAPETDAFKTIVSHVAVSEILRAAQAVHAGKATKRQMENLAEAGLMHDGLAGRIAQQPFEVTNGVSLPNTADWKDRAAADAFNAAVGREVDIAVVTPGQEKPLFLSRPVLSLLGQFKSFTASATERILVANLMRRDAATLQGLVFSVGLGMLSYKLNSFFGGQETSDRPQDWIKEGISRGGVLGWFEEGNAMAAKLTRGGVDVHRLYGADKPLSRYASRSTADIFLGPTAGKLQSLSQATGAAVSGDWSDSDTHQVRKLLAFQNLFYLRGLLNQAEKGVNGVFGVPQ